MVSSQTCFCCVSSNAIIKDNDNYYYHTADNTNNLLTKNECLCFQRYISNTDKYDPYFYVSNCPITSNIKVNTINKSCVLSNSDLICVKASNLLSAANICNICAYIGKDTKTLKTANNKCINGFLANCVYCTKIIPAGFYSSAQLWEYLVPLPKNCWISVSQSCVNLVYGCCNTICKYNAAEHQACSGCSYPAICKKFNCIYLCSNFCNGYPIIYFSNAGADVSARKCTKAFIDVCGCANSKNGYKYSKAWGCETGYDVALGIPRTASDAHCCSCNCGSGYPQDSAYYYGVYFPTTVIFC